MGRTFTEEPSTWTHGKAEVSPGVKLHYVDSKPSRSISAGNSKGKTIVLIHGFPQTWYCWRQVIQPLSELGFRVIAVDYRGAGDSDRPRSGYDKLTMSRDIHTLFKEKLGVDKAIIVGSDIGSMVASNLAVQFQEDVEALITFEAPIPGTKAFDKATTEPSSTWSFLWHFFFHNQADLPELLIQGKEKEYIGHFYHRLCYDPSFVTDKDLEVYAKAFSAPGGIRCGLDTYRAFLGDKQDFTGILSKKGKLSIPVLTLAGDSSPMQEFIEDQTNEYAKDVIFRLIPRSMHWVPEENPDGFVEAVEGFLKDKRLL
ncbi:hypothetical protein I302_100126 [Kwoniella bestiolae CBS 10118]|uniref:AB hydrolase-1 domain-containing protein n=1 Tax=Kwoniella bestiolae CBS 10118 TaxID=1296100 RepID=A0A1B9G4B3_9TREE|nr:hypothetical protein I302_03502 [Kwoniella bestiolae CBS 10118]OCF25828.1 hypothetical protein I302_03502 [Kwoniella bestiolae CBS 10118]